MVKVGETPIDYFPKFYYINILDNYYHFLNLSILLKKPKISDKMSKQILSWEGRFLSKAGKELLIKSVA